jgi:hypothetical protein
MMSPYRETPTDTSSVGKKLGALYRAHRPRIEEGPLEWTQRLRQYVTDPDVDRVLAFVIRCHEEVDKDRL